jgi:hypothetical protein
VELSIFAPAEQRAHDSDLPRAVGFGVAATLVRVDLRDGLV